MHTEDSTEECIAKLEIDLVGLCKCSFILSRDLVAYEGRHYNNRGSENVDIDLEE